MGGHHEIICVIIQKKYIQLFVYSVSAHTVKLYKCYNAKKVYTIIRLFCVGAVSEI